MSDPYMKLPLALWGNHAGETDSVVYNNRSEESRPEIPNHNEKEVTT